MQHTGRGTNELENMAERLVVIAQKNIIDVDDLPPVMKPYEPEEILCSRYCPYRCWRLEQRCS